MLSDIPSAKGHFPFRIGATSYIIPDDILPNVSALAPLVDDIELLLFETPDASNMPDSDTVNKLNELASRFHLTYTVHLPLDMNLSSRDESARRDAVSSCRRVFDSTGELNPFAYVLHLDADDPSARAAVPSTDMETWTRRISRSIHELLAYGISPQQLCVETLSYGFEWVEDLIEDNGLAICLDIGHLILYGYDVPAHVERYMTRTRIVHAHGVRNSKDHLALDQMDPALLGTVIDAISRDAATPRVFTMEVFSSDDFEASMRVMQFRTAAAAT